MTQIAISPEHMRHVLGQYPTGVAVVTAQSSEGEPLGMIVGSFASVSLDPPLVSFMPDKASSSWAALQGAGTAFCINVLGADQAEVCRLIASRKKDKFDGIPWHRSERGHPVLSGCVAAIECERYAIHDGGDHDIVLGRVLSLGVENPALPLVFFRGGYGSFTPNGMFSGDADLIDHMRLVERARPHLDDLAKRVGCEVTTVARQGDEVVVTSSFGQRAKARDRTRIGYRAPFVPPLGSIHAAWGSQAVQDRWVNNLGPDLTEETVEQCRSLLAEVRRRGYATSVTSDRSLDALAIEMSEGSVPRSMTQLRRMVRTVAEEFDPTRLVSDEAKHVRGVIAPVFDGNGEVAFQLMIWGNDGEAHDASQFDQLIEALLETAEAATVAIGGTRVRDNEGA